MKERPINLKPWEVRAILRGEQTQLRRVVEVARVDPHPQIQAAKIMTLQNGRQGWLNSQVDHPDHIFRLGPYGVPGDRLWARESWQFYDWTEDGEPCIRFAADDATVWPCSRTEDDAARLTEIWAGLSRDENYSIDNRACDRRWRSSVQLFRWASRILLDVVNTRVERLQAITDADSIAEGCAGGHGSIKGYPYNATPREHFQSRWERTYGPGAWGDNPWVWCISVRRCAP